MDSVRQYLLKQLASIQAGHPFRGKIPERPQSQVLAVQMKDVNAFAGINWNACTPTEPSGKRQPTWLQAGQLLFTPRGARNYTVVVEGIPPGQKALAAPQFFIIQPRQQVILPEFLAWQLNQAPCQQYFEQQAEGTLTKSIRRSVLEATPIAVPSLASQQSIVNLARAIRREQEVVQQLVSNGERLLGIMASDLLKSAQAP